MVSFYCTILNLTLMQVRHAIEYVFPENESSIVENGTVLLSDGDVLECSVEPDSHSKGLYLSADFRGSFDEFDKVLSKLKNLFEENGGVYEIECEIHSAGDADSRVFRHPEYEDAVAQLEN